MLNQKPKLGLLGLMTGGYEDTFPGILDRQYAYAMELAPKTAENQIMVVTVSGRGDKDCAAIARYMGEDIYE